MVLIVACLGWIPSAAGNGTLRAATHQSEQPVTEPAPSVTSHRVETAEGTLDYTATVSETFLRDASGNATASIFSIAYTLDGREAADRPVAFVFNGGPGSSSIWLHMGAFGPWRVVVPDTTNVGAPPYELAPNPLTLLAVTDLVFVDPVGTGLSRALGDTSEDDFWSVGKDAESITEFIRIWLTRNRRWNSPRYLVGESYGTIRIAAMVDIMQEPYRGMAISGAVLVAPALDVATFAPAPGNVVQHVLALPSYAAAAWYHDALPDRPDDRDTFLQEVEAFARGSYATALLQGGLQEESERREVQRALVRYTGLSEGFLERSNLRIERRRFRKELLRDRGLVIGRLDARYVGREADDAGQMPEADPASYSIDDAYVSSFLAYLCTEISFCDDREYRVLNREANRAWERPEGADGFFAGFVDYVPSLARALRENSELRVFMAVGLYDLTTPYPSARYMANRIGRGSERIVIKTYDSGHMMYNHPDSFTALSEDVRAFIGRRGS